MSEQSSFAQDESPSAPTTAINPLKLLSLLLLLPAVLLCSASQVYPAVDTLLTSRTDGNLLGPSENIGFENYERLFEDGFLGDALTFTVRLTVVRVLIIATIPLLVGLLVGMQPRLPRLLNRMCLSVIVVTLSPAILAILWYFFFGRTWDFDTFDPAPFEPLPDYLSFRTVNGARNNLQLLDAVITLGVALGIGSLAFMAVARGRKLSKEPILAGVAAWLLGILFAVASFTQTFDLSRLLTGGGPINATMTLPLHSFAVGFERLRFGYASAQATLEIIFIAGIATLIWAIITVLNVRLRYVSDEDESSQSSSLSIFSLPLILLLGLPVVGLMLWGLWIVLSNGGFGPAFEDQSWGRTLGNSLIRPWLAIWIIQLPLAYLVGLTLGFFRPVGRIASSVLFLPFVVFAMMPVSAMQFAWFDILRERDMLGNLEGQALPWLFGGLSLIILKMFFDGAHDAHQEAVAGGKSSGDAFTKHVILPSLPIVLALGVALSLFAAGDVLWPLIIITDRESLTATVLINQMLAVGFNLGSGVIGSAVFYGGLISLIFLPIVALLHIFALDRLALVAGATVSVDDAAQSEADIPDETEVADDDLDAEEAESED